MKASSDDIRRRPSLRVGFRSTKRTFKNLLGTADQNRALKLKYRFDATLITTCTYAMKRFGRLSIWFQRIGQRCAATSQLLQLIALLLSIPCFKASHFFFKLAYAVQQRRLRLACNEDFFLKFYDRRIASGSIVNVLQSLREIERGLKGAQASKNFPHHDSAPDLISYQDSEGGDGRPSDTGFLGRNVGCTTMPDKLGVLMQSPIGERACPRA